VPASPIRSREGEREVREMSAVDDAGQSLQYDGEPRLREADYEGSAARVGKLKLDPK